MILEEGKIYDSKSLAEWFGMSYDSFRRKATREKKFEILKEYADYERIKNSAKIIKVHSEEFFTKETEQLVEQNYDAFWEEFKLLSGTEVARRLIETYHLRLKVKTLAGKINKYRAGLYGKADGETKGTRGYSRRQWGKQALNGDLTPLTQEEYERFKIIRSRTLGTKEKSQKDIQAIAALIETEGYSEKAAWTEVMEERGKQFIFELKQEFGCMIIHGTVNWSGEKEDYKTIEEADILEFLEG